MVVFVRRAMRTPACAPRVQSARANKLYRAAQAESRKRGCGKRRKRLDVRNLAADAHFTEAQHHAATVRRAAETESRAETREHHHLVELAIDGSIALAGKN